MNSAVEHRLVKYGNLPDIELLVAGHHGSKYSTSEELLLETKPETAVISTGYNTYGHPAPETLERLAAAGATSTAPTDRGRSPSPPNHRNEGFHAAQGKSGQHRLSEIKEGY